MAQHVQEGVEAFAVAAATKATQGGALVGFLGWAVQINWIGLMGVLIGLLGLAANFYFQHRRDKREERESVERINSLREQCGLQARPK